MKLSAMIWSVSSMLKSGELDQNGFIELCAGLRMDGVELFASLIAEEGEDRQQALAKTKSALETTGMKLAAYVVHNDFTNPESHETELENIPMYISEAKYLDCNIIRILGGSTGKLNGASREEGLKNVTAGLKQAVKSAEAENVVMALENHGDLPGTAEELVRVIKKVDSPNLKACFDMGNFLAGNMAVKQNPLEALKIVLDNTNIVHVHIKDRRFKPGARGDVESCICGTGAVPLQACVQLLKDSGYTGFLSCECEGEEGIGNFTAFSNSVANIRTAIEKGK